MSTYLTTLKKNRPLQAGIALILFAFLSGIHHDYIEYIGQWKLVFDGSNPWLNLDGTFNGNAYGPTHLLYAGAYALHPLAPKVIGAIGYVWIIIWLLQRFSQLFATRPDVKKTTLLYLFSPFFLLSVFYNGDLDMHVAFWVMLSLIFLERGREVVSGMCLALAVGLKFFPIAYLPLLAYKKRFSFRPKLIVATAVSCIAMFGFCYVKWGNGVLAPFLFAGNREPKLLSIFRYLEGTYSPLIWMGFPVNLQILSLPLMTLSAIGVLWLTWRYRLDAVLSSLLMTFALFLWYKVGHQQFYLTLAVLFVYWYLRQMEHTGFSKEQVQSLDRASVAFAGWLSLFTILHIWTGQFNFYPWGWIREICGLIHFVLMIWILREIWRLVKISGSPIMRANKP